MDLNRLAREWGAPVAVAVFVALGAIFQVIYQGEDGRSAWWLILGVGFAALAAATPFVDARLRRGRREAHKVALQRATKAAREQAIVSMNDALDPLVETMGELLTADRDEREAVELKLITQALYSAAAVIGPDRTRVNDFRAEGSHPGRRLVCEHNSAGRAGQPQTVFSQGQKDGDFMFKLLEDDETHFCANVNTSPPPGWDASRQRDYETFISVPARVGNQSVGFVTADSVAEGDLKEQDVPLLRVMGTVIAAGVLFVRREA